MTVPRFRPADLAGPHLAGSPTLAPDGTTVVTAVQTVDPDGRRYRSRLFRFGRSGGTMPLTDDDIFADTLPVYSPDGGRVAFVSTRDGRRQAHTVVPATGQVRALGPVPGEVLAVAWLDARTVVAVVEHARQEPGAPIVLDWLRYKRDGETAFVEPVHELWAFGPAGPRLLHRPDGRVSCLTPVPGGLAFALDVRHADEPAPPCEVRVLDVAEGTDRPAGRFPSKVAGLAVTGSGTLVAVAAGEGGQSATPPRLWCLDGTGAAVDAFPGVELEAERATVGDSRPRPAPRLLGPVPGTGDVLFLATTGEDVALYRGTPGTATVHRLTPPGESASDFSAAEGGRVAVCVETPTAPVELRLLDLDTGSVLATTDFNTAWAATRKPVPPRPVALPAPDLPGGELRGLLYRAPGEGPGPLVVRVHGGPHLAFGTAFDLESQVLLSAGYSVLLPNLRGSTGRGAEFRAASVGQWGLGDHTDLMAFVDDAVRSGVADPDRLYLSGGSYGGYLVNWTLTRTGRFRAAVAERSISNLLSKYGTADNGFTVNRFEFGGADLFDDGAAVLLERSPLRHAPAITTPLLLLHGENDHRCPIEQSEQLFVALRRLGREVRLIRFPGESHSLALTGRPTNRRARLDFILDWFARH